MSSAHALHPIEQAILKALAANKNSSNDNEYIHIDLIAANTGLSIDQVRRGIEWLKFKNLISISESSSAAKVYLAAEGAQAKINGLPERRLVNAVKEGNGTIGEILASGAIRNEEVNAAIAGARRNQWIQLSEGKMVTTNLAEEKSLEESFLEKLHDSNGRDVRELTDEEKKVLEQLKRRPNYIEIREQKEYSVSLADAGMAVLPSLEKDNQQERKLTTGLITSGKWKEVQFSPLDVEAPAPVVYPGRRHPLIDIIEEVKEIFVGLGFAEVDGPIVQSGFWNFDALFTPQDHPAREMQDTFYVLGHKQTIPATEDQIKKISHVHKQR